MEVLKPLDTGISATEAAGKLKASKQAAKAEAAGQKPDNAADASPAKKGAKETAQPEPKEANRRRADNKGQPKPETQADDDVAQGEDDEDLNDEDQATGADDGNDGAQDQDDDGSEAEETGENGEDDADDDDLHTLIVDGREMHVTYEDMVSLAQQGADYSRKMNALAKDRKEVDALKEATKDLPNVKKRYDDGAERFTRNATLVLNALAKGFLPPEPNIELKQSNPTAYYEALEKHREGMQFVGGLEQELLHIGKEREAENAKLVAAGRAELFKMHPDFSPSHANGEGNRQRFMNYVAKFGFTPEQIAKEPSAALFSFAIKAMRYDELMANKAKTRTSNPRPKVQRSTKAPEDHKAVKDRQKTEAKTALAQSGSISSAANVLKGLRRKG